MWKPGLKEIVYDSTTKASTPTQAHCITLYEVNWDSLELTALEEYAVSLTYLDGTLDDDSLLEHEKSKSTIGLLLESTCVANQVLCMW